MTRQHIVFLTGAGISVESGLSTFRGKDGMWTNEEWAYLASTDALYNDTQRCLDFYNYRRKQLAEVEPNDAHRMIAELEKEHEVTVITQNVDNLHERAGSSQVIHLHGELSKVCSMDNRTTCVKEYPLTTPIMVGDKADDGSQLRPYIVMFGEYVDSMNVAIKYVSYADCNSTTLSVAPHNTGAWETLPLELTESDARRYGNNFTASLRDIKNVQQGWYDVKIDVETNQGKMTQTLSPAFCIGDPANGIAGVESLDSGVTTYFSIDGRRLPALQKGLNIVRMANGDTFKVMK